MPSDPNDPERKNNIDPKPNVPNETNNTEKATDIDSKKGNDMKNTICYIIIMLLSVSIYSQGGRDIKIEYQHSKRIPYNYISIEFQTLKMNTQYL